MSRSAKSTKGRALPALATIAAIAAAAPQAADGAPAAVDEYSLGAVGERVIERSEARLPSIAAQSEPEVSRTQGVVGETAPAESPLEALGAVGTPAGWALAAALVVAGVVLLTRSPGRAKR